MSGVRTLDCARICAIASSTAFAASGTPRCLSIIAPDQICPIGIANPIGQIWSGAMMLRHLGVPDAANAVEDAIAQILAQSKVRTPDIGGTSTTKDLGAAIALQVSN